MTGLVRKGDTEAMFKKEVGMQLETLRREIEEGEWEEANATAWCVVTATFLADQIKRMPTAGDWT